MSEPLAKEERDLGMGAAITRGDYARASGNTREVAASAHRIRDKQYTKDKLRATATGEVYDLIVVGGGLSGLGAAHFFQKNAATGQTCLILENHLIFGGEARENEFLVDGHRLIAPQGRMTSARRQQDRGRSWTRSGTT